MLALNPENFWTTLDGFFTYKLFTIGSTPVTPISLMLFLVVFMGLLFLSSVVSKLLASKLLTRLKIEPGLVYTLQRITYYVCATLSAMFSFQFVGVDLGGLAVIFGLLSVGIGFGLQNITSNFISGVILLLERPIKVGDRLSINGQLGDVVEINMRATTILTTNNVALIVPNSEFISAQVVNWSYSDPKIRLTIDVGVSYNSDLQMVMHSLNEVAENSKHGLKHPKHDVLFLGFGDSSWNMQLRLWIKNARQFQEVRSEINCDIVEMFRKNHIEIPFPQHDIHFRNPLSQQPENSASAAIPDAPAPVKASQRKSKSSQKKVAAKGQRKR